jgi:mRNA (guanine-N7-)-methyltransferase
MVWMKIHSHSGHAYYYNSETGESAWTLPAKTNVTSNTLMYDMVAVQSDSANNIGNATVTGTRIVNNWIKRILITHYCPCNGAVLDLCCGKGGDLLKYKHRKIKRYIGVDVSDESIRVATKRASPIISFTHEFVQQDVGQQPLVLKHQVNFVSAQFCLHYFFKCATMLDSFMTTVSTNLEVGGVFVCTFPDSDVVQKKLHANRAPRLPQTTPQLYDIQCTAATAAVGEGVYGKEYLFTCGTTVVNSVEYLVDVAELVSVAKSKGLHRVEEGNAQDFLYWESVVDTDNCVSSMLTKQEWEVVSIYKVIAFRRVPPSEV